LLTAGKQYVTLTANQIPEREAKEQVAKIVTDSEQNKSTSQRTKSSMLRISNPPFWPEPSDKTFNSFHLTTLSALEGRMHR